MLEKNILSKIAASKDLRKKIAVTCEYGHIWGTYYFSIKAGNWCPECAGNKPYTIKQMYEIAKDRDGRCLSTKYNGTKNNLKWWCNKCRFTWMAPPTRIVHGGWCPKCARKFVDIDDVKALALRHNSACLSDEYISKKGKLKWKCNMCNDIWETSYRTMYRRLNKNRWCLNCN